MPLSGRQLETGLLRLCPSTVSNILLLCLLSLTPRFPASEDNLVLGVPHPGSEAQSSFYSFFFFTPSQPGIMFHCFWRLSPNLFLATSSASLTHVMAIQNENAQDPCPHSCFPSSTQLLELFLNIVFGNMWDWEWDKTLPWRTYIPVKNIDRRRYHHKTEELLHDKWEVLK